MQVTAIKEIKANVLVALRQLLFFTKILATGHFGTPGADAVGTHSIHLSPNYLPASFLFLQTCLNYKYVCINLLVKGTAVVWKFIEFQRASKFPSVPQCATITPSHLLQQEFSSFVHRGLHSALGEEGGGK